MDFSRSIPVAFNGGCSIGMYHFEYISIFIGGGVLFTLDNVSLTRKKEHAKNDANVKKKVNENSLVKYKFIML